MKENEDHHPVCLPAVAIDKDTGLGKIAGAELFAIIEGCPVMCCSRIVEQHSGRKPDVRVEMVEDYGAKKARTWLRRGEEGGDQGGRHAPLEEALAAGNLAWIDRVHVPFMGSAWRQELND